VARLIQFFDFPKCAGDGELFAVPAHFLVFGTFLPGKFFCKKIFSGGCCRQKSTIAVCQNVRKICVHVLWCATGRFSGVFPENDIERTVHNA